MFDRYRFRAVAIIAISICTIGTGLFALSNTMGMGALARACMGFGSAFAFLAVLTVADRYFVPHYFAFLTGIAQLLAALGGMAGEFPVAFVVHQYGWRETLAGLSISGLLLVILVRLLVPASAQQGPAMHPPIWQILKNILKNKQIWSVGSYAFLNWAAMTAFASLWGIPFLTTVYHLPTETAANVMALIWLGVGLMSPVISGLSDWLGQRNPLLIVTGLIGMVSMGLILYIPLPLYLIAGLLFLTGLGCSGQILTFAIIKDEADAQSMSTSIGFINMAEVATGLLVQPIIGKLIEWHAIDHHYKVGDYQFALSILPLAFGLSVIVTLAVIRETYCGRKE
jgi:predicted MFS family arabinose efflux permease